MIYTSYNAMLKYSQGQAINIMRYAPKFLKEYDIENYPLLCPSKKLLDGYKKGLISKRQYYDIFWKYLEKLNCDFVYEQLMSFAIDGNITLYCCEKYRDENDKLVFCHRHIVARWFRKHGYTCRELLSDNDFYLLVVGTRTFGDYKCLSRKLNSIISEYKDYNIHIVSGGAKGADELAEKYAKKHNYDLKILSADWDTYGKRAGYIRNDEMHSYIARNIDRKCIAFWDGKSKGTKHSFELAEKYGTDIEVIEYNK